MTIYTDGTHLVSDLSIKELHEFALGIGMKRHWFQNKRRRFRPHYDLMGIMNTRALAAGAIEVDERGVIEALRRWRKSLQV